MASKKPPKLKGALSYENAKASQKLFAARSRGQYTGTPGPPPGLNLGDVHRIVFGVHLEILAFAGSLMYKSDQDAFQNRFTDLYQHLESYRQDMGKMFDGKGAAEILRYIDDVAAGGYDMVDAYLGIQAEYRPQLLQLVRNFIKGELVSHNVGRIPDVLLQAVPDQNTPQRLYGEYYDLGYRIQCHNNVAHTTVTTLTVRLSADDLETCEDECRRVLLEQVRVTSIPSAGLVYRYFPMT